ncbi:MAG: twitching motility protein PilT [Acidobacteria bacterium RIFCSPLOWO2_02_FULL_67_21]|nr:MAG: twitching motility protein PilT [Acidobacteria bacterium RIFCSPLOWO2_02_FULL_67_21]
MAYRSRHSMKQVTVRVYGPLNDFLPPARRQAAFAHAFEGRESVKDLVEGLGIPHPEIDLILVNGEPVAFDYAVQDGNRIAVFPRFESVDIAGVTLVRPPLGALHFVLDGHLGRLARYMRLVGLDATYLADASDDDIAALAAREGRIVLTRDRGLLKLRGVSRGYWIRATMPRQQLVEVLHRFGPMRAPFSRCLRCNAELREVPKASVESRLEPRTREYYQRFHECPRCHRIYWAGSHWQRLTRLVESTTLEARFGVS